MCVYLMVIETLTKKNSRRVKMLHTYPVIVFNINLNKHRYIIT